VFVIMLFVMMLISEVLTLNAVKMLNKPNSILRQSDPALPGELNSDALAWRKAGSSSLRKRVSLGALIEMLLFGKKNNFCCRLTSMISLTVKPLPTDDGWW